MCGEASGVEDGLREIAALRPDGAIVDLSLGRESGLALVAAARRAHPELAILVLSMFDEMTYAERALKHGANGYVMKQEATERLITALHRVLSGKNFVSPSVAERLLSTLAKPADQARYSVDRLTDRELEVFDLIGRGLGTGAIAEQIGVSIKTIETYRANIKTKLNLKDATDLIRFAATWTERL